MPWPKIRYSKVKTNTFKPKQCLIDKIWNCTFLKIHKTLYSIHLNSRFCDQTSESGLLLRLKSVEVDACFIKHAYSINIKHMKSMFPVSEGVEGVTYNFVGASKRDCLCVSVTCHHKQAAVWHLRFNPQRDSVSSWPRTGGGTLAAMASGDNRDTFESWLSE